MFGWALVKYKTQVDCLSDISKLDNLMVISLVQRIKFCVNDESIRSSDVYKTQVTSIRSSQRETL